MSLSKLTSRVGDNQEDVFKLLYQEVILPGLCSHCGTCVGLSKGRLIFLQTQNGPLPVIRDETDTEIDSLAFQACPGKGLHYPHLYNFVFGKQPENWLLGCYENIFVGYSCVPEIRLGGASGGVITQSLLFLLEKKLVDGVVVLQNGLPQPWLATPIIATKPAQVIAASQSVYVPAPVNSILDKISTFNGKLAFVGLPDQISSLRELQRLGNSDANKVEYVFGPYVGTVMYFGAIESYLRSNGIRNLDEIIEIRYRDGEWPGYLRIKTRSGREIKARKFYYNYLIPFYITRSTLYSVDFTNELTDISVGDAWSPKYEKLGKGFSVVIARTSKGSELLNQMRLNGLVQLDDLTVHEALAMHGHMFDFKKRGSFIRILWRKRCGKKIPDYGYSLQYIPFLRKLVEIVIFGTITLCSTRFARGIIERIPVQIIGPTFDLVRKSWKNVSKPTKRKGINEIQFVIHGSAKSG